MNLTPTIQQLIDDAAQQMRLAGIQAGRSEAELIVAHVLNEDKSYVLAHNNFQPPQAQVERIQSLFAKRIKRVPMSYVLGTREFYGRNFRVDERALTPRIETETIVAEAIKHTPNNTTALDLGTGCGALAISLKLERPDLAVVASDVSPDALALAQLNANTLLDSAEQIELIQSDLFSSLKSRRFGLIVANLPYVSTEADLMAEVTKEPAVALFGGRGDGLDLYRRFFTQLPQHLLKSSLIYIESDPWQQPALIKLATAAGLKQCFQDYFILGFTTSNPDDTGIN